MNTPSAAALPADNSLIRFMKFQWVLIKDSYMPWDECRTGLRDLRKQVLDVNMEGASLRLAQRSGVLLPIKNGLTKEVRYALSQTMWLLGFTFPNHQHAPAFAFKSLHVPVITLHIGEAFVLPELRVCSWYNVAVFTGVHMKETAMNVDYFVMSHKD